MAVLKIARLGHPILRQVAEPVSPEAIRAPEIQRLIDDMLETMAEYDGAGLAAPQVHVSRRVVIYGVEANPRYPEAPAVPLTDGAIATCCAGAAVPGAVSACCTAGARRRSPLTAT